jgi:hypothetical protein
VIIWAATSGLLDDVETAKVAEFESGLYRHLESGYEDLLPRIAKDKVLSDETIATLEKAVAEFKHRGGYGEAEESARPAPKAEADDSEADASEASTAEDADAPATEEQAS